MNAIKAIALNTFKEAIRDRILYVIVVFGILMIVGSLIFGSISLDQDAKIITDFGLAGIFLFNVIITIFIGTTLVHKEIDKRSIFIIFSKPVKTYEFVIGKFLGLGLTILVTTVFMSAVYFIILAIKIHDIKPLIVEAVAFSYLEVLVLVSLTMVFSSFTAPIASAVYTLCLFIIGHSSTAIWSFAHQKGQYILIQKILEWTYYFLPNLEKFNIKNQVVYDVGVSAQQAGLTVGYGLIYIILLLVLSTLIVRKQEF